VSVTAAWFGPAWLSPKWSTSVNHSARFLGLLNLPRLGSFLRPRRAPGILGRISIDITVVDPR
jgi:hypothetical protein